MIQLKCADQAAFIRPYGQRQPGHSITQPRVNILAEFRKPKYSLGIFQGVKGYIIIIGVIVIFGMIFGKVAYCIS